MLSFLSLKFDRYDEKNVYKKKMGKNKIKQKKCIDGKLAIRSFDFNLSTILFTSIFCFCNRATCSNH